MFFIVADWAGKHPMSFMLLFSTAACFIVQALLSVRARMNLNRKRVPGDGNNAGVAQGQRHGLG